MPQTTQRPESGCCCGTFRCSLDARLHLCSSESWRLCDLKMPYPRTLSTQLPKWSSVAFSFWERERDNEWDVFDMHNPSSLATYWLGPLRSVLIHPLYKPQEPPWHNEPSYYVSQSSSRWWHLWRKRGRFHLQIEHFHREHLWTHTVCALRYLRQRLCISASSKTQPRWRQGCVAPLNTYL